MSVLTWPRSTWPCSTRSSRRPGGGDQDVDAAIQRRDLAVLLDAAVENRLPDRRVLAVFGETLVNLNRQLARRGEHERANLPPATVDAARLATEPVQNRQCKCGRLAGSGLSTAENISPFQDRGNRGGLNLGGGLVPACLYRTQQRFG